MRHVILSLVAILALSLAAPAEAQTGRDGYGTQDRGTMGTQDRGTMGTQDRGDMKNFGAEDGAKLDQVITGTVIATEEDNLVLRTDDGRQMTFHISGNHNLGDLDAGQRVQVEYTALGQNRFQAGAIYEVAYGTQPGQVGTQPGQVGTQPGQVGARPGIDQQRGQVDQRGQAWDEQQRTQPGEWAQQRGLPGTASPAPLVGLSALLALGAGFGVWLRSRRG